MKFLAMSLIYIAFFALIGCAVYFTKSGWPLFALLLTPTATSSSSKKDSP